MNLQSALTPEQIAETAAAARHRLAVRDVRTSGEVVIHAHSEMDFFDLALASGFKAERQRRWQRESMRRLRQQCARIRGVLTAEERN